MSPDPAPSTPLRQPSLAEAFRFWLKLGFISFGGPSGQIALMHREVVEKKRWMQESHFLHALQFCMLLPGPEAQQLATYIGWVLHRTPGALIAGILFFLPAAFLLWLLSWSYVLWGKAAWMTGIMDGLKPAVLALVLAAVWRVGKKSLLTPYHVALAGLAWLSLSVLHLPYPAIIAAAAITGWLARERFQKKHSHPANDSNTTNDSTPSKPSPSAFSSKWVLQRLATGLAIWWLPILAAALLLGHDHILVRMGLFFSKAALVTFGGAYAVLPYVAQQAVEVHQWLSPAEVMDGLGLAETTPGPLIMVLQFVGFIGGWHQPHPFTPLVNATLASVMTTWCTFVPSLLWIIVGAPFVEWLRHQPRLQGILSGVSAAVVGVILHLAVWFGWHVLFPENQPVNVFGWIVSAGALLLLTRTSLGMIPVILLAGLAGWLHSLI